MDASFFTDLTAYILPAKSRDCDQKYLPLLTKAFDCWLDNTKFALLEEKNHDIVNQLTSDGFLDYDEFALICHKDSPIGLFMFRWIDLRFKPNRLLSAIYRFPDELIQTLCCQQKTHVMLMGNLAVDSAWRRHQIGFGIADVLMGFATRTFLASDATVLLTTTRNNRSTNTLCYRQGGQKYAGDKIVYGTSSDVVLFNRENVKPHPLEEVNAMITHLWECRQNGWIQPTCDTLI